MSNRKFFCSDLHFSHTNIVKYTNRGVETTQEQHDEWLIDLWNSQVNAGDIVYHMGDFSFAHKYGHISSILTRLNGTKKFIYGNHDGSLLDEALDNKLLDSLKHYDEIKLPELNGQKLVLFHYPIGSFHHQARGNWHLHGHCHGNYKDSKGKMLDVGLDNAYNLYGKHRFFSVEDLKAYMDSKEIYVSDHHKEIRHTT